MEIDRFRLFRFMQRYFNSFEFSRLCYTLDIDEERLVNHHGFEKTMYSSNEYLDKKMHTLIDGLDRGRQLSRLVEKIREIRPDITDEIPSVLEDRIADCPNWKDVKQQEQMLEMHRKMLLHYLKQQSMSDTLHILPNTINEINETREKIRQIKRTLRKWGFSVEDHLNDEENPESLSVPISQENAKELLSSKSDEVTYSVGDKELLIAFYVCFDRPAFKDSFKGHSDLDGLMAAIGDTIAAVSTGVKKRRDGIVFGDPVKGKSYFERPDLRKAFDEIVFLLSKAKATYTRARKAGYFFEGSFGLAFHSDHAIEAIRVAVEIDRLRNQVLSIANGIYSQMGMKTFPYIETPEHYLELRRKQGTASIDPPPDEFKQNALHLHGQKMLSVLFLSADPTDASRLRLGKEFHEIQEKLKLAKLRDYFRLELPQLSVRPSDISQALLDVQPQIVHFSGHGRSTGVLCFENQIGQTHPVRPDALAALFEQFVYQVNCVLLSACYSEIQAKAIAAHIDYVIGMNQAISDEAAIAFTIGFYQALGAGRSIEEAYKLGCVLIRLANIPEHLTPVLVKKRQVW